VNPFPELSADIKTLREEGLYRKERIIQSRQGADIVIDDKGLINFSSNDYLGLACHPEIVAAMQNAAGNFGVGSSASPLVSGKTRLHVQLEQRIATITGRERALLLSCGYMANLAIFSSLIQSRRQEIYQDRLCHASMIDGAATTGRRIRRYAHANPAALEALLKQTGKAIRLVLTESVFSMNGDIAPLPELARLCQEYNACLVVDDAHGFGVIGSQGLGGMDYFSLGQNEVPLMMATFGKALGVYGAFVAGPAELLENFVQRARPYIYSTALPPPIVAAALAALEVQIAEPERRNKLNKLVTHFRAGAEELGIKVMPSISPIQPVLIGSADDAVKISLLLEQKGIYVSAIRPPTVPANSSRLRITLSAAHSFEQIDYLLQSLRESLDGTGR
jgi:8-amino-7-oxononanoate synthase